MYYCLNDMVAALFVFEKERIPLYWSYYDFKTGTCIN